MQARPAPPNSKPHLRILSVGHTPEQREFLRGVLQSAGMIVDMVDDGAAGLAFLSRHPPPDVIIVGVNMPGLDGFGFTEAVRRKPELRILPILVLTREKAPELKARARAAGASGWIGKPYEPLRLIQTVRAAAGL